MESKLPTQEELIDSERKKAREKTIQAIKDNLNYIYISLMILANCIISLLRVEDGVIGLRYPKDGLGWALWITQILVITFLGILILNSFRRQGIKSGHKLISATYQKYLETISTSKTDIQPRSLQQYMRSNTIRDSFMKGGALIAINLLVVSVAVNGDLNSLLALVVNILMSLSFGIHAMLSAENYVIEELVVWYKLKIKELTTPRKESKK